MKTFLCLIISVCCGCASSVVTHGIPNLAQVSPGVWRGGQPSPEGWAYLKSLGVRDVVKLNPESEAVDSGAMDEGMTIYYCPISLEQQIFGLNSVCVTLAGMSLMPGTYVHCAHGQDRTGLCVAIYRVKICGWSKADAENEMLAHGFHKELIGLWEYWKRATD